MQSCDISFGMVISISGPCLRIFSLASVQGAALFFIIRIVLLYHFNPHSRTGSDLIVPADNPQLSRFQSTLPHGERLEDRMRKSARRTFQSTLPHGERLSFSISSVQRVSFQSTLPHGERLSFPSTLMSTFPFQSTLPHGERPPIGFGL